MPIRFSQEFLQRQAVLCRGVEPEYFAWIDDTLRATSVETSDTSRSLEPIVSVDDLCAFVRGEGYADDWREKYGMRFIGFPTINGASTYAGADTIEDRWWAWWEAHGHREEGIGPELRRRALFGRRVPTLPRKPRSETGLYTRWSLPLEIPPWVGFRKIPGMELIIQDARPLWPNAPTPPSLTAKKLGLVGSLEETWVTQAAVEQSENVRRALLLPFPQTFYEQHLREVLVVWAHVFQFDNAEAPRTLLAHPDFTLSGRMTEDGPDPHQVRLCSLTIGGGLGFQWMGNETETYYQWDWATGAFFNEVSVVGYGLPVREAHAVALMWGDGGSSDGCA